MFVVTIGREYGSGGRFIARKLAETLNVPFYDNELLAKASQESGISPTVFQNYDEKKEGFFSGIIPNGLGFDLSLGQRVFLAQFETIRKLAQSQSCVIVGRCADYVLREYPNAVHIFITASQEDCITRAIKYYDIPASKAKDVVIKMNKNRASYYNFYSDKKWGRADSYDLCINSSVGIDESVEIIKQYVEKKLQLKL